MAWSSSGTLTPTDSNRTFKTVILVNEDMDRVWALDVVKNNSNIIGIGYDEGTVVIKIGSDEPVVSMK